VTRAGPLRLPVVELVVVDPGTDARYAGELDLRYRVLRAPLGMGRHEVGFAGEAAALHVLATGAGSVVGCVLFDFASGRLRAMAVDPGWQRAGLGARLVRRLEDEVQARGVREVKLHARADVVGFYERLGYVAEGPPFTEVGISHRAMARRLPAEENG
jgi:GNAT superfamily N-acetyltransferase